MRPTERTDYSIAAVSKLTGVSCHSLRVWERRYGFPVPHRLASGHRRYSPEQVATLRDLAARVLLGQPIGRLLASYRDGRSELTLATSPLIPVAAPAVAPAERVGNQSTVLILLELLTAGEWSAAESILDRLQGQMSPLELVEGILAPLLVEVGERAFRQETRQFQQNLASVYVISRLHRLLDQARRANPTPRRRVLIGTVEGDRHEGATLMASLALELAGWRAVSLGTDLPVAEFAAAVHVWQPDALALSFVLARNINKRFAELASIRAVPVFVGGRSIVNHQRLARRFGLIPVLGPLSAAVAQLILDTERWYQTPPTGRTPGRLGPARVEDESESENESDLLDPPWANAKSDALPRSGRTSPGWTSGWHSGRRSTGGRTPP